MATSTPAPLKVAPAAGAFASPAPSKPVSPAATPKPTLIAKPEDISSPHELTAFVETLLSQLESKFDDMSSQIFDRMTQMSGRVDALEASIQDLINSDIAAPSSPGPGTPHRGS